MGTDHKHRICTFKEAEEVVRSHEVTYVNDCFCRGPARDGKTKWEYCGHPVETCMGFVKSVEGMEIPSVEITQEEALTRMDDWKRQGNFFRFMLDEAWVCFCCTCGCVWFRDEEGNRKPDPCDKSPFTEKTDAEACTLCGVCVDLCPYDAREIRDDEMRVDAMLCYGCSACEYACPEDAIEMVARV